MTVCICVTACVCVYHCVCSCVWPWLCVLSVSGLCPTVHSWGLYPSDPISSWLPPQRPCHTSHIQSTARALQNVPQGWSWATPSPCREDGACPGGRGGSSVRSCGNEFSLWTPLQLPASTPPLQPPPPQPCLPRLSPGAPASPSCPLEAPQNTVGTRTRAVTPAPPTASARLRRPRPSAATATQTLATTASSSPLSPAAGSGQHWRPPAGRPGATGSG